MTFEMSIPATVAIISLVLVIWGGVKDLVWMFIPAALIFAVSSITYCESRPEKVAMRKARIEEDNRLAQPHVIREADGCKVYGWKDSSWHYFTRCSVPGTVTTDRSYTVDVKCGKNCTRKEPRTETIVTEENNG